MAQPPSDTEGTARRALARFGFGGKAQRFPALAEIEGLLRNQTMFRNVDESAIRDLADSADWFSLPGGWSLFEQGEPSDAVYFVLVGTIAVVSKDAAGVESIVGYVRAGEPIGEMSLFSGEAHSASAYALRDAELLRVSHAEIQRILRAHPELYQRLTRLMLIRARQTRSASTLAAPRVFAFIGASPSINVEERAKELAERVRAQGRRAIWFGEAAGDRPSQFFDEMERTHDVVILAARMGDTSWYRFALRHADRFWVFARRDAAPPDPMPLSPAEDSPARRFRLVDLVMLPEGARAAVKTVRWVKAVGAARLFHWRSEECANRLARVMAGKSVGVVLSGGGARAYAHVGALKAIREAGIPIDFIGGTSMGGIVAAAFAMGWDDAEMDRRLRAAFVDSNPLGDHRLPVVALTKGRRVEERLQEHFGDVLIEHLSLPFYCVSADLVSASPRVHSDGLLRDALRASISLPGMLPPVVDGGAVLVDGAILDNFPADVMRNWHRGVNVGVDVAREGALDFQEFVDPPSFFSWVMDHGFRSAPPIVNVLMRSATVTHDVIAARDSVDLLISPEMPGMQLRHWRNYDMAVDAGYAEMKAALETAPPAVAELMNTCSVAWRPARPLA